MEAWRRPWRAGSRERRAGRLEVAVRVRNGSRDVFNEATVRALQAGERVQVIAGVDPGRA
jgi:hypothetical protein